MSPLSSHKGVRGGARVYGRRYRVEPEAMVSEPEAMVLELEAMV